MREYPTAAEARKISNSIENTLDQEQTDAVFELIEEAAKYGSFTINIRIQLRKNVIEVLNTLGYKVENKSNQFDTLFKISW